MTNTWTPLNFNDRVRVRLTDGGRTIAADGGYNVEEDADGRSTWQLWEIAQAFGEHCYLGGDEPFSCVAELEVDGDRRIDLGEGSKLTRGDGHEIIDTKPVDIFWGMSDDDRPTTTIRFAGLPEIRLSDADARALARSISEGKPDAVRGEVSAGLEVTAEHVHFVAEIDGEVLHEEFWIDVQCGETHLCLYESGELHDGLVDLSEYEGHFVDGVYANIDAYKRGEAITFADVFKAACAARAHLGVTEERVRADDARRTRES